MKIGKFEVGEYVVKDVGGKKHLVFDCKNCVYGCSLADDPACRFHVLTVQQEADSDLIVLADVYERVYDEPQTLMMKDISQLARRFETESVWSYAHLGTNDPDCEPQFGGRHDVIVRIAHDLIGSDPVLAYLTLLQEIKKEADRLTGLGEKAKACGQVYLDTLLYLKKRFEDTRMVAKTKEYLTKLRTIPDTKEIYRSLLEAQIKPAFIGSRLLFGETEELELLDEYQVGRASAQIFSHPNKTEKLYFLNPPEYTLPPEKYFVLSKTKEVVASYKPGSTSLSGIAKSRKYFERVYESTIVDIAQANKIFLSPEEAKELAEIVARYTVGYGMLELILSDKRLTDIFVDSPIGMKPLYVVHSDFGQCQTNILYTEEEANSLVSKMRAMSGRPFDEAHPVLDFDLPDLETRVAVIGKPLAPDGIAFAFRLHKVTPWTLPQFIDNKFINPLGAGLLSFFVDQQATMLVTGSRGSGKTSLLQAMMLEILQNARIICQEDSVTGDSRILLERNGKMEFTTVGELIDDMIQKHGHIDVNGVELLDSNPENVHVFSLDKNGKTKLSRVSQFSRHAVSKDIFKVTTVGGKSLKVTKDHSLFGLNEEGKIVPVKTVDLKVEGEIAVVEGLPASEEEFAAFFPHALTVQNAGRTLTIKNLRSGFFSPVLLLEKVAKIEKVESETNVVYDFSVPECENFVCENIIAHNTLELPVEYLKNVGFNIQRLKTRSPISVSKSETEVSPAEALRTALRLGDSALVIGEVRSSIRGKEEVVIVENGITRRVPIKDVEKKCWSDILVPTLDHSMKACLAPLSSFVKHPKRSTFLEVTTKTGRKVTVTEDHSLFTQKGFSVEPVECKDLKTGQRIVIPAKMPSGFNDIEELDLTTHLQDFRVDNNREFIREAIKKVGWKKATQIVGIKHGDIYNFFRRNQKSNILVKDFLRLMKKTDTFFDRKTIVLKRTHSTGLPGLFPVNEDFCRFLGYYLSEGCIDPSERAIIISNSNQTIIDDIVSISRTLFGCDPFIRKTFGFGEATQIRIDNSALAQLMLRMGCGRTSMDKRVPSLVFGLKKEKIAQLLKGFYSGDGSFTYSVKTGHSVRAFSKTKKLMEDVLYLLLCFGIVGRIQKRKNANLWTVEFKRIEDIKTFFHEIGFVQKKAKIIEKAWPHSSVNLVEFSEVELLQHLEYSRKYRHLKRFKKCSKYYLQRVVLDNHCVASEQLKVFARGDFYLDEVVSIREINLKKPEFVYDLSVEATERFIGGFGGILLHNTEARVLYEAMRVGAAGNIVLGTIHGDSAYSVWDRVVNDLQVPTTSFKATDVVVVARPIRFAGSLKRARRVVEITEVKKHWIKDPDEEGGLLDLMMYTAKDDKLVFQEDALKDSELFQKISRTSGLNMNEMWTAIKSNASAKAFLVDLKNKYGLPLLLEAENYAKCNNKYMLLREEQLEAHKSVDYDELLGKWKFWVQNSMVKRLLDQKSRQKK